MPYIVFFTDKRSRSCKLLMTSFVNHKECPHCRIAASHCQLDVSHPYVVCNWKFINLENLSTPGPKLLRREQNTGPLCFCSLMTGLNNLLLYMYIQNSENPYKSWIRVKNCQGMHQTEYESNSGAPQIMPSEAPSMDQAPSTWQEASGTWDTPVNATQDAQTQDQASGGGRHLRSHPRRLARHLARQAPPLVPIRHHLECFRHHLRHPRHLPRRLVCGTCLDALPLTKLKGM